MFTSDLRLKQRNDNHNHNPNYNLMGFDTIEINLLYFSAATNKIRTMESKKPQQSQLVYIFVRIWKKERNIRIAN